MQSIVKECIHCGSPTLLDECAECYYAEFLDGEDQEGCSDALNNQDKCYTNQDYLDGYYHGLKLAVEYAIERLAEFERVNGKDFKSYNKKG